MKAIPNQAKKKQAQKKNAGGSYGDNSVHDEWFKWTPRRSTDSMSGCIFKRKEHDIYVRCVGNSGEKTQTKQKQTVVKCKTIASRRDSNSFFSRSHRLCTECLLHKQWSYLFLSWIHRWVIKVCELRRQYKCHPVLVFPINPTGRLAVHYRKSKV